MRKHANAKQRSGYDATFVALAQTLGVPLVTCDAHLASAPGVVAELYRTS